MRRGASLWQMTKEEACDAFQYDSATGKLYWKIKPSFNVNIGDEAGGARLDDGYYRIRYRGRLYRAHQLVWLMHFGTIPKQIDHINMIRSDNRIENLREASNSENQWNQRAMSTNTSGVKGVTWHKDRKKWQAQLNANGVHFYLGLYDDIELAELVVQEARRKYHGEFANDG